MQTQHTFGDKVKLLLLQHLNDGTLKEISADEIDKLHVVMVHSNGEKIFLIDGDISDKIPVPIYEEITALWQA